MKSHSEMHEGPDAFERFKKAIKAIVDVPKSALPVKRKKKKTAKRRA